MILKLMKAGGGVDVLCLPHLFRREGSLATKTKTTTQTHPAVRATTVGESSGEFHYEKIVLFQMNPFAIPALRLRCLVYECCKSDVAFLPRMESQKLPSEAV